MRVKVRLEVNKQELQHLDDWLTDFIKQLEPDEDKESGDEELSASDIQEQLLQNHVRYDSFFFLNIFVILSEIQSKVFHQSSFIIELTFASLSF